MRRLLFVFFLLLASCSLPQKNTNQEIRETYSPVLEAFEPSKECPNICWLGIHPGTTTYEQALHLITISNQFEQEFTEVNNDSISAVWIPDKTKKFQTAVRIAFTNNLVDSIMLGQLVPFTVEDFVKIFGQPSEISLWVNEGLHGEKFTVYTLYYPSLNSEFQILIGGEQGPEPTDFVRLLKINFESQKNYLQPWLGYGHFDEYMLRAIPTSTIQASP